MKLCGFILLTLPTLGNRSMGTLLIKVAPFYITLIRRESAHSGYGQYANLNVFSEYNICLAHTLAYVPMIDHAYIIFSTWIYTGMQ